MSAEHFDKKKIRSKHMQESEPNQNEKILPATDEPEEVFGIDTILVTMSFIVVDFFSINRHPCICNCEFFFMINLGREAWGLWQLVAQVECQNGRQTTRPGLFCDKISSGVGLSFSFA